VELLKALLLGIIQGATEFLPVSSSGHLVLGSHILGFQEQGIVFDVMLHLGTLVSVLLVFRREIIALIRAPWQWAIGQRSEEIRHFLAWDIYIIVATLPAVFVGLFLKDRIELLFDSTLAVYLMLFVTGVMLIVSRSFADGKGRVDGWRALLIGCGQACAIAPGLSRSGTTIFVGMMLGVNRETAARFSFLMSIPAIVGAAVLNFGGMLDNPPTSDRVLGLAIGSAAAAVTGYLAIILLLDVIRKNRLPWFGFYCISVAAIGLVFLFFTS